jgi:hypothetical protein
MVFLIKIARKITAFNKIFTHHQYFFLNKKLYYETLSFLTKVGNMGFGNLVLILPIKHEHAHVVVVKNGGCNTSHSKRAEQAFYTKYTGK